MRSFDPEDIFNQGFVRFFTLDTQLVLPAVDLVLEKLHTFLAWFESQSQFSFYASSLLVVYESDPACWPTYKTQIADVRLIDFAHVFPITEGRDENFLKGLRTLIGYLERLKTTKWDSLVGVPNSQG